MFHPQLTVWQLATKFCACTLLRVSSHSSQNHFTDPYSEPAESIRNRLRPSTRVGKKKKNKKNKKHTQKNEHTILFWGED
jgi:hypothetical protein